MALKDYIPKDPKMIVQVVIIVVVALSLGVIAKGQEVVRKITKR